jgi:hypothetical protein
MRQVLEGLREKASLMAHTTAYIYKDRKIVS